MSIVQPGAAQSGLVARVKAILMQTTATWDVIDTEPATVGGLYRGYIIPLAAIGPICQFLHNLLFGLGVPGLISIRLSPIWLGVDLIVSYVFSLAIIYVFALIIDALAPNFGGTKNQIQAFKVAAYAPTAGWIAAVMLLVPLLGILAVLGGLYSLYLLYRGLPRLMKTPEDKALPYTAVVIVAGLVVGIVAGAVWGSVSMMARGSMFGSPLAAQSHISGNLNVPGGGSVDLGKLQAAAERAEAASKQMQAGNAPAATDPEVLKGMLPASVAGFNRTEVSTGSGGAAGIQGSSADGTYSKGDASIRLEVTDMGAAGALAGMAGAFNVKSSKETSTGYEKVGKVDGRLTQESYDNGSHHGEYSVMVGDRFMVQATGDGVSMDELKAAVAAIPAARLEGMAKSS